MIAWPVVSPASSPTHPGREERAGAHHDHHHEGGAGGGGGGGGKRPSFYSSMQRLWQKSDDFASISPRSLTSQSLLDSIKPAI